MSIVGFAASAGSRVRRWFVCFCLAMCLAGPSSAIHITLDYTLDEQNENWFDPSSVEGLRRRGAVGAAAEFLSQIITNDDWAPLNSLNESFSLSDIASPTLRNIDGSIITGTAESDGAGYSYSSSFNNIDTTNRSSVAANEYIVYIGAFAFDSGSTANAKGGYDSSDRRNSAGYAGTEFNTWGGRLYFNTTKTWYTGTSPGIDPTDNYGVQDSNKSPSSDTSSDNWDWSTSSNTWKGFQLSTVDPSASGQRDLYATAMHEIMHALGATSSVIDDYVGVDSNGDFIGENLVATYGGPVPGNGGHFDYSVQSVVWGSEDIVSEVLLDPDSLAGVRKYFTNLDAALLRDLGYEVLESFDETPLIGDFNDDGVVDLVDYTVWRNAYLSGTVLPNDNTPGGVWIDDFADWKQAFAAQQGTSLAGFDATAVPEPLGLTYCLLAIGVACGVHRHHRVSRKAHELHQTIA